MVWTETTRPQYCRKNLRYASDLRDEEWDLISPVMPPPKKTGRPRKTNLRDVVNALLYMASTGCQWRMLPRDFPAMSTVQGYFYNWRDEGLWLSLNHLLLTVLRKIQGKKASPTGGVIDS